MNFELTDRQKNVYETVGSLARERFAPRAAKHDLDASTPLENLKDLYDAGLYGLTISEDMGGMGSGVMGRDPLLYLLAIEQTARSCMSTAHCVHIHCHGAHYVDQVGTSAQRERILGQVIKGGALLNATGSEPGRTARGLYNLVTAAEPTKGGYLLNGRDVSALGKRELSTVRNQEIGFVFQGFNLLPRTSAVENVELPLLYAGGIGSRERRSRAIEALRSVGLGDRLGHHPNQLSGGQQQRVAIARALVNNPKLLLADEPTGNLDSRTSIEVMGIFQRLNEEQGLTIVLVTHEHDIAEYGTRVVAFRDGTVRSDQQVLARRRADEELTRLLENAAEEARTA